MADQLGQEAFAFLKEKAVENEHGKLVLPSAETMEFYKNHGVTEEHLSAVRKVEEELVNGMYLMNYERLQKRVEDAKTKGTDPMSCSSEIYARTPDGSIHMRTVAARTFPVPHKKGETITKTMVTMLDCRRSSILSKDMAAECEEGMRALLGLG